MPVTVSFRLKPETRKATPRRLLRTSDGDTPYIEQPVRMVSCDTPEKDGYAGGPEKAQQTLDRARERLAGGFYDQIPQVMRTYLIEKLTQTAAADHIEAGHSATKYFDELLGRRLRRSDGAQRSLAIIPSGEIIDPYGRLLAYFAPWFTDSAADPLPPKDDPERRTFNLDMIDSGWAAFFPIYPSLPADRDFNMALAAAESAWNQRKGAWKNNGSRLLLAYEYRACIKLARADSADIGISQAFERHCVDLRNNTMVGRFGYADVPPPYRMWVWPGNIQEAMSKLRLTPAE